MTHSLRRRALTLIELVVVLLILAATAGILVPRLIGYGERAHGATSASSMQETAKAIALYEANNGRFPSRWDNLIDVDGGASLPGTLVETGVTLSLTLGTLGAGEAAPLQELGITQVLNMDSGATGFDATFQPWEGGATPTLTNVADGLAVALIPPTALGRPATSKIVALGLGSQCELFGATATEASVVFEGGMKPSDIYLRYLGAFEIVDAGTVREKARFLGVVKVEPADGSIAGAGTHLQVYYEARDQ